MKTLFLLILLATISCTAQNTLSFKEINTSPKAQLEDIKWITGHWKGKAFGGTTEEIWSPPLGGSMMFVFKLVIDNTVNFYEIGHIKQVEETLLMQLKHFSGSLKAWEEKEETIDFKLVKVEENRVYFDGLTFEKINPSEINIYVVITKENGSKEEVKFNYKKQL